MILKFYMGTERLTGEATRRIFATFAASTKHLWRPHINSMWTSLRM